MRKIKLFFLPLMLLSLFISCSKDDEPAYAGLGKFDGKYRLNSVNPQNSTTCYYNYYYQNVSLNDLEIYSNGRFKRKIYTENNSGECVVSEILEGEIEITGSFYGNPYGEIKYDNSDVVGSINIKGSDTGVHNEIIIRNNIGEPQYSYFRTE